MCVPIKALLDQRFWDFGWKARENTDRWSPPHPPACSMPWVWGGAREPAFLTSFNANAVGPGTPL